jgi:hypothetical protein
LFSCPEYVLTTYHWNMASAHRPCRSC